MVLAAVPVAQSESPLFSELASRSLQSRSDMLNVDTGKWHFRYLYKDARMLVIISDLHLSDGTTGPSVHPGAFELFGERLSDLAMRASWRSDGQYRPIDRIDLVLLGDSLDLIRSHRWLDTDVRPWHDAQSPYMVETVADIVNGILQTNHAGLSVLRSLAAEGAIRVAPASQQGPVYDHQGQPVPVRIHYMVGNHDWMLHLPGTNYDLIRQKVAHHMGRANRHDAPFAHDPIENDELLEALRRHRVFARHGDIFDPLNFAEDRDSSSLGDAIVVELITRFAREVQQQLGDDLPVAAMAGLRELDNIRPILLVPVWIDGLLERTCPSPAVRKAVKRIWDELADQFLALDMVRDRDTWSPFDLVDGLEGALKFSKRLSLGWATKINAWMHGLRGGENSSYYKHALSEQDFRNRRARHIVYGHTHVAESIPLDASYADGYVLNQVYFNSGTWRRLHRQTQLAPSEHEFIVADSMSYLSFFHGDERSGRPFETWSGQLGITSDVSVHRVDKGQTSHAAQQPVPAPNVPIRAPHFATPTGAPRVTPVRQL